MADLTAFAVKTAEQIRNDILRTYSIGLQRRGVTNPNVAKGTEFYARAEAVSQQLAVCYANLPILADALMPDSAQGSDFQRIAAIYGLALGAAGTSAGSITFSRAPSGSSLVAQGAQLLDDDGQSYQVTVGGSYASGDPIPIASISTGASTNLVAGTVLRWATPPAFSDSTAAVSNGGLTGGTDAETIEGLRARLLDRLRTPPAAGNAANLIAWAEAASAAVGKGFAFPCPSGPASVQVCVTGAPSLTNKSRAVDALVMSTVILPALIAQIPEYVQLTLTTPSDVDLDVSIGLAIPAAASAGGPGGGWLDAAPWPVKASQGYADVTAVVNSTQFTINADVAPTANVSRICWLSPFDWTLYAGTVVSFTGSGPYQVTVDQPFVGIAVGEFISPQAEQSAVYFNTLLDAFAALGPGQITNLAGLLPRALRQPLVSLGVWPSDPIAPMLRTVEDAGTEVLDVAYLYRSATSCPLPAAPSDGPKIFVPRRTSFYPL